MLVDCRKAARAGLSTLAHLMLSQPFTRRGRGEGGSANTWNWAQAQESTDVQPASYAVWNSQASFLQQLQVCSSIMCGRERDRQSLAQSWAQQGIISGLGASTQPDKQPQEQTCGLRSSAATSENRNTNACLLLKLFYNVGYI